jgi:hypothetical protein
MPMPAHFKPNLIAAALSCAGIIIGSIGPWTSFLASERTGISECGVITLVLGIGAAFALTPLLWRGVTPEVKNHYIGPLVGIAVLIVAVGNAVKDLAAMNKVEMLPWDEWGRMTDAYDGKTGAEYDLLLDEIAEVCAGDNPVAVRALYEHEDLRVPENLIC